MEEEVKPTEELKEEIEQPEEAPSEEVVEEPVSEEQPVVENSSEDRSAFNCSSCNGDGLIWHEGAKRHDRCPACAGTGKVS